MDDQKFPMLRNIWMDDFLDVERSVRVVVVKARSIPKENESPIVIGAYREIPKTEATHDRIHKAINECLREIFVPQWLPGFGTLLGKVQKETAETFNKAFEPPKPTEDEKHADHEACKELVKTRHVHPYGRQPTFQWNCVECGLPFNVTRKSKLSVANDRVFHEDMAELDEFRRLQGMGKCLNE